MRPRVLMYTKEICPYCTRAEALLRAKGVEDLEKIHIDGDDGLKERMIRETGRRTVPQIFIGDTHVGGYDDLAEMNRNGLLEPLLEKD